MKPYFTDGTVTLHHGDSLAVLREMPDQSVDCCVTSPPYFGLRDYGVEGQYGLESSPAEYVETMRALFAEVRRVLADDGTLWLNLGDSYSTHVGKPAQWRAGEYLTAGKGKVAPARNRNGTAGDVPAKNLLGIPWRTAFGLQDDGWILRNDIIWSKPNAMPESVSDRLSTRHEHLFLFSKSRRYWFDLDPIREANTSKPQRRLTQREDRANHATARPNGWTNMLSTEPAIIGHEAGRNPGDVWTVPTQPFAEAHFAVMPQALAERAILAGCKPPGTCVECGQRRRLRDSHWWHCVEPTCDCADDEVHMDTGWQPPTMTGTVLDPFSGSGTTGLAATKHGRKYVGIDLSSDYLDLSLRTRFAQPGLDFGGGVA